MKYMRQITILFLLLLSFIGPTANAQDDSNTQIETTAIDADQSTDQATSYTDAKVPVKKPSAFKRWWENVIHGNIDRTFERPLDITFAGAPFYSQESSLGLGLTASALFRIDRTDSLTQVSDFSINGGLSITGNNAIGASGNVHFNPDNRINFRLVYKHQKRDFWGVNFADCARNHENNNSGMIRNQCNRILANIDYMHRIKGNWFVGGALRLNYTKMNLSNKEQEITYLRGLDAGGYFTGVGALIQYDSRDYILNPKRGIYFLAREIYYPHFLGKNKNDVFYTTLQFDAYHKLWTGALLCYDFIAEFNHSKGDVPWQLRNEICTDDRRMRGYYTASYIDDNQICAQIELRQHIWKRIGAVAWVGCGTLFHDFKEIKKQTLGNFGVGFRFELKHNTNIRFDYGFGKGIKAFVFNYAEAF